MKKILGSSIAAAVGLIVLGGYLFQSQLGFVLRKIIDWGFVLVSTAGLIGIGYLLRMHFTKIIRRKEDAFYSIVVLVLFSFTFIAGLVLTTQNSFYQDLILNVQIPVEASLLGILAVTLLYGSLQIIRTRGWSLLSVSFILGALLTLILNLGFISTKSGTLADCVILFLRRLPLAGARGILLGMALGGLIVGLRVLLTVDRPYGEG